MCLKLWRGHTPAGSLTYSMRPSRITRLARQSRRTQAAGRPLRLAGLDDQRLSQGEGTPGSFDVAGPSGLIPAGSMRPGKTSRTSRATRWSRSEPRRYSRRGSRAVDEIPDDQIAVHARSGLARARVPQPPSGGQNFETEVSLSVMNSRRAGCPSRVARIPRSMAGTISPGSVTRSPKAPNARAIAA